MCFEDRSGSAREGGVMVPTIRFPRGRLRRASRRAPGIGRIGRSIGIGLVEHRRDGARDVGEPPRDASFGTRRDPKVRLVRRLLLLIAPPPRRRAAGVRTMSAVVFCAAFAARPERGGEEGAPLDARMPARPPRSQSGAGSRAARRRTVGRTTRGRGAGRARSPPRSTLAWSMRSRGPAWCGEAVCTHHRRSAASSSRHPRSVASTSAMDARSDARRAGPAPRRLARRTREARTPTRRGPRGPTRGGASESVAASPAHRARDAPAASRAAADARPSSRVATASTRRERGRVPGPALGVREARGRADILGGDALGEHGRRRGRAHAQGRQRGRHRDETRRAPTSDYHDDEQMIT